MTGLQRRLASAAAVYADLLDASLPGAGGDPDERPAPDPTRKPAPGNLSVLDHRHELVRLLRWWVDAVHEHGERTVRMGSDVPTMARYLAANVHVMADEDAGTLYGRLGGWLDKAARFMGEPDSPPIQLDAAAYARTVPQAVAAQALGVPVSTIWRRNGGRGGPVVLADVAKRCGLHDMLAGQCADCA